MSRRGSGESVKLRPEVRALCLVLAASVAACVPVAPYSKPPGYYGSRSDLGDGVPDFIVAGRSTRAQVVARLGAAEVESPDGHWLYYQSNYLKSESGAWVVAYFPTSRVAERWPAQSELLLRRLRVSFDPAGVVAEASFEAAECRDLDPSLIWPEPPAAYLEGCPVLQRDLAARAERQADRRRMATSSGAAPATWFEHALWRQGEGAWMLGVPHELQCEGVSRSLEGEIGISRDELLFLPPDPGTKGAAPGPIRIVRADILAARRVDGWLGKSLAADVTLAQDRRVSFALCGEFGSGRHSDVRRLESALALLAAVAR